MFRKNSGSQSTSSSIESTESKVQPEKQTAMLAFADVLNMETDKLTEDDQRLVVSMMKKIAACGKEPSDCAVINCLSHVLYDNILSLIRENKINSQTTQFDFGLLHQKLVQSFPDLSAQIFKTYEGHRQSHAKSVLHYSFIENKYEDLFPEISEQIIQTGSSKVTEERSLKK